MESVVQFDYTELILKEAMSSSNGAELTLIKIGWSTTSNWIWTVHQRESGHFKLDFAPYRHSLGVVEP